MRLLRCFMVLLICLSINARAQAQQVGPPPEMSGFCGKVFTATPFCNESDCYLLDECMDDAGGGWEWEQPCFTCIYSLWDAGVIKHCDNQRGWCKFPFDVEP